MIDPSPSVQYAFMNAARTGNVLVDTILALLLPVALGLLCRATAMWRDRLLAWWRSRADGVHVRLIEHRREANPYSYGGAGTSTVGAARNGLLQRAILAYMGGDECPWSCDTAKLELRSMREDGTPSVNSAGFRVLKIGASAAEMQQYDCRTVPVDRQTIRLNDGVTLCTNTVMVDKTSNSAGVPCDIIELRCGGRDGDVRISAFVTRALRWYALALDAAEDKTRYMYTPTVRLTGTGADTQTSLAYKRYPLSDCKTFRGLFFRDKDRVLAAVRSFQSGDGRYGARGSCRKLGLLLHGPPGTGKTSFIKALAHATGRHVVNIRLSQIGTNEALMDMINDLSFPVVGVQKDAVSKLDLRGVLFVMEDVDCMGDVTRVRAEEPERRAAPEDQRHGPRSAYTYSLPDELNMAGLLNVLDGVVENPHRLLVMTTNHPERLDPALVRPGRIDMRIHMGLMAEREATELIEYQFEARLTSGQRAGLAKITDRIDAAAEAIVDDRDEDIETVRRGGERGLSPALLEQLCAEHEDVDAVLRALAATSAGESA